MSQESRVAGPMDYLSLTARVVAGKELELEAKGFPPGAIKLAIERAWGQAEHWASKLDPETRERAFLSFITVELEQAEGWCKGVQNFISAPPPGAASQPGEDVVE